MFAWAAIVYLLCLAASAACAWLLVRSYFRNRTALLLWSAACFVFLALNNLIVVIDILVLPEIDLTDLRLLLSLAGATTLICGFIREVD